MEDLKRFYEQEKKKHQSYVEYNDNRNKSLYSTEELEKFNDSIRHSSEWLRKIENLINKTYIFDDESNTNI
jgi:hypothetical protein